MSLRILYTSVQPINGKYKIRDYHERASGEALYIYRATVQDEVNIAVETTATIHSGTPDLPFYIVQVMLALSEK